MSGQTGREEIESLIAGVKAIVDSWDAGQTDAGGVEFDRLALRAHRFQRAANPVVSGFIKALGLPIPERWQDIPALPTAAFKRAVVSCFPPTGAVREFRTSGTTEGETGRHFHTAATLALYDAAALPNYRRHLFAGAAPTTRPAMVFLTAPPLEAPHSSLIHMFAIIAAAHAAPLPGFDGDRAYLLAGGLLNDAGYLGAENAAADAGLAFHVYGTAFAFAELVARLDGIDVSRLRRPELTVMETGGFKGRVREIPRPRFHADLSRVLGVAPERIINEYGMTELGSQFYDQSLVEKHSTDWKIAPPWTRVRAVDPETGVIRPDGTKGLLRIWDLANLGSTIAIQTEDVGVTDGDRFRVFGRVPGATPRGCGLPAENLFR